MAESKRKPQDVTETTARTEPATEAETGTVSHPANIPNPDAAREAGLDPTEKPIEPGENEPTTEK